MVPYSPLHVSVPLQDDLEENPPTGNEWMLDENTVKNTWLRRLLKCLKWLNSKIPFFWLYPLRKPVRVKEIEQQLLMRGEFPSGAWREFSDNTGDVESILRFISAELNWPNHFLIPNDLLRLALITAAGDNLDFIAADISEKFDTSISGDTIYEMGMASQTVGDLVRFALHEKG